VHEALGSIPSNAKEISKERHRPQTMTWSLFPSGGHLPGRKIPLVTV
jgi:hypothetical protein